MTPGARKAIAIISAWLFLISVIVLVSASTTYHLSNETNATVEDLADTRTTAVRDACKGDQYQNQVIRSILLASLRIRALQEKQGLDTDGPTTGPKERRALTNTLMAPLGGLDVTKKELKAECDLRIKRGAP